jgi:hypothetical protein
MSIDPERRRIAVHEGAHVVLAVLLGFRPRLVRVGAEHGGFVDLLPDFDRRPEYRDPLFAPFALFLCAGVDDFTEAGYLGPLPAALPVNGARAALDIVAILTAGRAIDGIPASHPASVGSDQHQIAILLDRYPALRPSVERLQAWLPGFLSDLAPEIDAVADALLTPSTEAAASWLGLEDLERLRAGFDEARFQAASRTLKARLEALALLAEAGWRDVAA